MPCGDKRKRLSSRLNHGDGTDLRKEREGQSNDGQTFPQAASEFWLQFLEAGTGVTLP